MSKIDPSGLATIRINFKKLGRRKFEEWIEDLQCRAKRRFRITYYGDIAYIDLVTGNENSRLGQVFDEMFRTTKSSPFDFELEYGNPILIGALSKSRTGSGFTQLIDVHDLEILAASGAPSDIITGLLSHEFNEGRGSQSNRTYLNQGLNAAYRDSHANEGYGGENESLAPSGWKRTSPPNNSYPEYTRTSDSTERQSSDPAKPLYPAGSVWGFGADLKWGQIR